MTPCMNVYKLWAAPRDEALLKMTPCFVLFCHTRWCSRLSPDSVPGITPVGLEDHRGCWGSIWVDCIHKASTLPTGLLLQPQTRYFFQSPFTSLLLSSLWQVTHLLGGACALWSQPLWYHVSATGEHPHMWGAMVLGVQDHAHSPSLGRQEPPG